MMIGLSALWHSIRFRLLLAMLVFMLGLYFWMQHNVASVLSNAAIAHTQASIRLTSEALNLAVAPHTTAAGLRGLSDYFHELLADDGSGLLYLSLYDDHGELLVTTDSNMSAGAEHKRSIEEQVQDGLVHVVQPILILDNRVGELRFGLSTLSFRESIQRIQKENLNVLLVAVLVFGAFLFLGGMQLNRRLMSLMRATRALAQGDYRVQAPALGQDELSLLASDFNAMARSVTERMQALEESRLKINDINSELELRVSERTWELELAMETLQEAQDNLIQSEKLAGLGALVAGVSHELNTPIGNALTVVTTCADKNKQFATLLAAGALRKSSLDAYLHDMQEAEMLATRNLLKAADLIRSFKQVAIDQTSYQRRRFDLALMLQEILVTIQPMLRQSDVAITVDVDPNLKMDSFPGPLGQIITNLVNNALTHAFDGIDGAKIRISVSKEDDDWLVLTLADNGKGIAHEHLGKVFDPFFTTRLGQGGSGLGLHIVHNLVTGILGGQIRVFSGEGRGTQFVLRLPLVAPILKRKDDAYAI
jgi:signal transduction histidine kinase